MAEQSAFWTSRGQYKHPLFLSDQLTNPLRLRRWSAYGSICALALYHVGSMAPICPLFVAICLLAGQKRDKTEDLAWAEAIPIHERDTDLRYLRHVIGPLMDMPTLKHLDRALAKSLRPWLQLAPTEPIPDDYRHPVRTFILEVLDVNVFTCTFGASLHCTDTSRIQIPEIRSSRDGGGVDAHDTWSFRAFFTAAFGRDRGFLGYKEFIAFQKAFNVQTHRRSLYEVPRTSL